MAQIQSQTLAIHGGAPIRKALLPYGQQWIDEGDIAQVIAILKSDFLTQGPTIAAFEEKVAQLAGARYAVAFCNGTAALHGACYAAGIGPGDEVITTPMTFAASANCVLYQGGTPVFADIDPSTYLIDLEQTERLVTSRTKAIIPVDFTGQPVDMRAVQVFARKHGLLVIQDAAHSFGAAFGNEPVGSVADMTMFSFHPVKPVTTGEGGVIVTNSESFYKRLLLFRSHGITRDSQLMTRENEGPWYYEMVDLGYNYRMTDIQAGLGLSQVRHLESFVSRRQELARLYDRLLEPLEKQGWLKRPYITPKASSGWHLYIIRLQSENLAASRGQVFEALRAEGIGVNVHYVPVHRHPYYEKLGYAAGICPVAEDLYERIITLPLFPKMTEKDIRDVVDALDKVLCHYARE